MKPTKRLIGLSALVAGAVLFMLWLAGLLEFGKIAPGTVAPTPAAPAGQTMTLQEEVIPQELPVLAAVISKSLVQVSPQVSGRVSRIWVDAGQAVAAGDPLVALSAPEFEAKVSQARGGVGQARAQLSQVSADHERYRRLFREGAVSPQEMDAMEARYQSARAALAQAQGALSEAAALQGYTVLKAPRAGVVAERKAAVGDLAQPGQPLLSLYDPRDLQIEGEINDDYRAAAKPGLLARIEVPAANFRGQAALVEVFPISQTGSRTFKVRTGKLPPDGLVPGMFAHLYLPLGATRGLLVPNRAVYRVGQLDMVEVLTEGRPTRRQVKLGRHLGNKVEVLAGLKAGDQVVLPPE